MIIINLTIYIILFIILVFPFLFLFFGIIIYLFPDNAAYLTSSAISGSFYIINNLDCIIYSKMKKNKEETFNTSIIIQIIIFFGSIFCQKYHLKYKKSESFNNYIIEKDDNEITCCESNQGIQDEINKLIGCKEQEELLNDSQKEENIEEEEINDQED